MTAARLAQSYRNTSIETASPAKLILMLFDGAVRFLNQALHGFEEEKLAARNETVTTNIVRAQSIIAELRASLNMDAGGDVASNLARLYAYMDEQLRQANLKKDRQPILLTQELLGEVRTGWAQMMQQTVAA